MNLAMSSDLEGGFVRDQMRSIPSMTHTSVLLEVDGLSPILPNISSVWTCRSCSLNHSLDQVKVGQV